MSKRKKSGGDEGGAPGWIVTFADLMSLLLTFFVLLLSFSETNVKKFKIAVGSIKDAFGVQTDGVYDHTLTSNRPFTKKFSKGSREMYDWGFNDPKINFEDKDFCNLKKRKFMSENSDLVAIKNQILLKQPNLNIFITKQNKLIIRVRQSEYFSLDKTQANKDKIRSIASVYNELNNSKLSTQVKITNYTSSEKFTSSGLKKWQLSNNRALFFAALSNSFEKKSLVSVDVDSQNGGRPEQEEYLDFEIGLVY